MPRAAKKEPKIDPDRIYVCWMSGAAEVDGQDVSFRQGERLRGDNPAVQGCPQFFVEDGTPDSSLPSHWDTAVERTEAAQAALPDHDLQVAALPTPIEAAIVEAARHVKLLVGAGGEAWTGGPAPTQVVTIKAGTRFAASEPIVAQLPTAFREV